MINHTRDTITQTPVRPAPGATEHHVHTESLRETSGSATAFIVGGLVVAVALIAFLVFGDPDFRNAAGGNSSAPVVENNVAPAAPP